MSVRVLVEAKVQADRMGDFTDYIASIVDGTRSYDGCSEMTFTVDQDDPTSVVFVETWESREKYEKYFAWRQESGALDKVGPMLQAPPSLRFLEVVEM